MTDEGAPVTGQAADGALGWPGEARDGAGLGWPGDRPGPDHPQDRTA